jgi:hypothetical protein
LTTANTAYQVIALIREIAECPGECLELLLEADAANAADSKISVGDEEIATDRYGYQLGPGDSRSYDNGSVKIGPIWVMGSADGLKLNVEVTV